MRRQAASSAGQVTEPGAEVAEPHQHLVIAVLLAYHVQADQRWVVVPCARLCLLHRLNNPPR